MKNLLKSTLIIIFLFTFQLGSHRLLIKPIVSQWGATDAEAAAQMPNDQLADYIVATRAITINKPLAETWAWINQLGADRSGFFSYYFIEQAMGYYTREQAIIKADFPEFKIGDLIRGSIDPDKSLIIFEFPVSDVKSNDYISMKNWGTFQVKTIDENTSRLIIRTHGIDRGGMIASAVEHIAYSLHFIMERATMNGLKKRIEFGQGAEFSNLADLLWFSFIVISGLLIARNIFILRGFRALLIPFILSSLWLWVLFILAAIPVYPIIMAVTALLANVFKPKRSVQTTNI